MLIILLLRSCRKVRSKRSRNSSALCSQRPNYLRCLQCVNLLDWRFCFPDLIPIQYNKYKVHLIQSKIPDGSSTTVYRCGPMIDLCLGPHVPHTGKIKAFMVTKVRSAYGSLCGCNILRRVPPLISLVTPIMTHSKEYMGSLFLIRSSSAIIRHSLLRPRSGTTERLAWNKTFSFSIISARAAASFFLTARVSIIPFWI
jgi:hypothetical protein